MIFLGTFACFHTVNSSSIGKIPKSKDKAGGKSGAFSECTSLVSLNQREPGTTGREAEDEAEIGSRSEAGENSRASIGWYRDGKRGLPGTSGGRNPEVFSTLIYQRNQWVTEQLMSKGYCHAWSFLISTFMHLLLLFIHLFTQQTVTMCYLAGNDWMQVTKHWTKQTRIQAFKELTF